MTPEELQQAVFLLGPWLIGCSLELFLQGILCCQFSHYISWYGDDKLSLRLAVAGLALLTTLKSVQSFALIWIQLILNFTDLQGAILLNYTAWWQSGNPLMVACIGLYVQCFFLYRLYVIARSSWVPLPIGIIFLFAFLSIIIGTYYITKAEGPKIGMWFAAHLSSVFAGDISLTMTTAFYLIKTKKNVLPQTVGLISALIRLTFQTSAPAALCAMFNLIFSQIYPGEVKIVSTAFNQMLPKLYAVSMMWTLNARRQIRAVHSSSGGAQTTSNERTTNRARRGHDVELGTFGGMQVHTHTETVQHVDLASKERPVPEDDKHTSNSDDYSFRKVDAM